HGDLVDDEKLEPPHQPTITTAADIIWPDQPRRKAEEGMNCLTADVDGREAGRCHNHHLLGDQVLEAAQQRRFARAGPTRNEQIAASFTQIIMGGAMLRGRLEAARPSARCGCNHAQKSRANDVGSGHLETSWPSNAKPRRTIRNWRV